jgi:hypothetical protein
VGRGRGAGRVAECDESRSSGNPTEDRAPRQRDGT